MKHQPFQAIDSVDYVNYISPEVIEGQTVMSVPTDGSGYWVYITKEQCMKFFGLVEAPTKCWCESTNKTCHACELLKATS